jgi:hypothetical protein
VVHRAKAIICAIKDLDLAIQAERGESLQLYERLFCKLQGSISQPPLLGTVWHCSTPVNVDARKLIVYNESAACCRRDD